jgi:hypothetical protein
LVNEAQVRHYTKWAILGINVGTPESDVQPTTYTGEIVKFKNWIATRLAWLDDNMVGRSVQVNSLTAHAICRIFPNPASEWLFAESDKEIKLIELVNISGISVFKQDNCNNYAVNINVSQLKAGVYLARVILKNGEVVTTRVVKK